MKTPIKFILSFALLLLAAADIAAQELITNVYGRDVQSLNGKWDAIVDLYDQGRKNKIYLNRKPEGKTDFYEYSFDNGLRLDVPSDWNCQMPELKYYEGTVWYARRFDAPSRQAGSSSSISGLSATAAGSTSTARRSAPMKADSHPLRSR